MLRWSRIRAVLAYRQHSKNIKLPVVIPVFYKNFQTTTKKNVKLFVEEENQFAYRIMEKSGYSISLNVTNKLPITKEQFGVIMQTDWSKKPPKELFESFALIADYCNEQKLCISNELFDSFIDNLTDNINKASDQELMSIFYSLNNFPQPVSIRTRNYIEVWASLDDVCLDRIKNWTYDDLLKFISLMFMVNISRISDFSKKALTRLASKSKQLNKSQFVQTMFYIGVQRKQPFDVHNLELYLDENFEQFSINDLAVISMGYFKSKTPIRNMDLVKKIIHRIEENSKEIHEISLAALLKVIRYSMKITNDDSIFSILDVLQNEVPRLSIMCNVHLALLGTSTLTVHEECLNKIADRVLKAMPDARLKDIERLVLTYGTFNYKPHTEENFIEKIVSELRKPNRQSEIDKYGRSFVSCLEYLGFLETYPEDLINKALSPEFLEKTYGKSCFHYNRAVLAVHNIAEIFCCKANINRLTNKQAAVLAKKFTQYVPDASYNKQYNITEKMFLDVYKLLEDSRGGNEYVVGDHIVTHHERGDIIICNNRDGAPLPVRNHFDTKSFGLLRKPPDNNIWMVFIIAGRNVMIRGSSSPTGHYLSKVREMKALGFYPMLVTWSVYITLRSTEDKMTYINELIKNATR